MGKDLRLSSTGELGHTSTIDVSVADVCELDVVNEDGASERSGSRL